MKYAHLIKLTAFSYEHENTENVTNAFLDFFPFDLDKHKIHLKITNATGFADNTIKILEATLSKDALINEFLQNLLGKLDDGQKKEILDQAESRLDSNLDFFLRFDKELWIDGRKLELTDSGKCFHLKISIAAFPKKREVALNIVKELFSK